MYDAMLDADIAPGKIPGKATYGLGKKVRWTPTQSNTKLLRIFRGFAYAPLDTTCVEMGRDFA
jgi:hypothetical protein